MFLFPAAGDTVCLFPMWLRTPPLAQIWSFGSLYKVFLFWKLTRFSMPFLFLTSCQLDLVCAAWCRVFSVEQRGEPLLKRTVALLVGVQTSSITHVNSSGGTEPLKKTSITIRLPEYYRCSHYVMIRFIIFMKCYRLIFKFNYQLIEERNTVATEFCYFTHICESRSDL